MIKWTSLLILFSVSSCVNQGGTIPVGTEFKRTMEIEVNGIKGVGDLVVPPAMRYNIKIKVNERSDEVNLVSCHRHIQIEKEGFRGRKKHDFSFDADSEFENSGYCPIHITSLDRGGAHEWAIIEIRNRKLGAGLFCNGEISAVTGVSICQAMVGLRQRITFLREVTSASVDGCGSVETSDDLSFYFTPDTGFCSILFYDASTKERHRLTVFGYNEIMRTNIKPENQFPGDLP